MPPCALPPPIAQVVLSLVVNALLAGTLMVTWSGPDGILLRRSEPQAAHSRHSGGRPDLSAPSWQACERPQLDVPKLEEWGCRVSRGSGEAAAAVWWVLAAQRRCCRWLLPLHAQIYLWIDGHALPMTLLGLQVFHKACFDQGGMILHSGEKTPDHPNFTPDPLFKAASYPCVCACLQATVHSGGRCGDGWLHDVQCGG